MVNLSRPSVTTNSCLCILHMYSSTQSTFHFDYGHHQSHFQFVESSFFNSS
ncbi:hypothetical protein AAG906_018048 [Vitis piasezkii]